MQSKALLRSTLLVDFNSWQTIFDEAGQCFWILFRNWSGGYALMRFWSFASLNQESYINLLSLNYSDHPMKLYSIPQTWYQNILVTLLLQYFGYHEETDRYLLGQRLEPQSSHPSFLSPSQIEYSHPTTKYTHQAKLAYDYLWSLPLIWCRLIVKCFDMKLIRNKIC